MQTHLVRKEASGKVRFLTLLLTLNQIRKEWGMIDGKTQIKNSEYKTKNAGKSNERSADLAALDEFNKVIKKKKDEGYVITESLTELPTFSDPFAFDLDDIPKTFCCSKPIKKITEEEIDEVISLGSSKVFVKYNGGCHYIQVNSTGIVNIYTRRWDDHTTKYPAIVQAVRELELPPNTLLMVELCIDPLLQIDHIAAFKLFSSISKTDTLNGACKPSQEDSLALQQVHQVKAAAFAYLYYDGEQLWDKPYKQMLTHLSVDYSPLSSGDILFMPQDIKNASGAGLMSLLRDYKDLIEGFILWDTSKAMKVTMNGKPDRKASWKVKARGETEVIAYAGEEGKVPGEYGSIAIGRYNAAGEFIPLGTVAGLKDEEKKPEWWTFPCVIEITYDNIFKDTGHFQFGNFSQKHLDKKPEDIELFSLV